MAAIFRRFGRAKIVLALVLGLPTIILPPRVSCVLLEQSVLWAFRPELSFIRFVQQVMIVTSIVLPAMPGGSNSGSDARVVFYALHSLRS